jgi:hypothetical protein
MTSRSTPDWIRRSTIVRRAGSRSEVIERTTIGRPVDGLSGPPPDGPHETYTSAFPSADHDGRPRDSTKR